MRVIFLFSIFFYNFEEEAQFKIHTVKVHLKNWSDKINSFFNIDICRSVERLDLDIVCTCLATEVLAWYWQVSMYYLFKRKYFVWNVMMEGLYLHNFCLLRWHPGFPLSPLRHRSWCRSREHIWRISCTRSSIGTGAPGCTVWHSLSSLESWSTGLDPIHSSAWTRVTC